MVFYGRDKDSLTFVCSNNTPIGQSFTRVTDLEVCNRKFQIQSNPRNNEISRVQNLQNSRGNEIFSDPQRLLIGSNVFHISWQRNAFRKQSRINEIHCESGRNFNYQCPKNVQMSFFFSRAQSG